MRSPTSGLFVPLPANGTATPSATISSPTWTSASSNAPVAEATDVVASVSAPPIDIPTALPISATVGEVYLAITASAETLTPSGLDQIRSQLAQHLGASEANIALNMLPGSVILQVTLSGERVDGERLAKQLEQDVTAGRLSTVVVGYVPPTSHDSLLSH